MFETRHANFQYFQNPLFKKKKKTIDYGTTLTLPRRGCPVKIGDYSDKQPKSLKVPVTVTLPPPPPRFTASTVFSG